jgi:hypothetical protein
MPCRYRRLRSFIDQRHGGGLRRPVLVAVLDNAKSVYSQMFLRYVQAKTDPDSSLEGWGFLHALDCVESFASV